MNAWFLEKKKYAKELFHEYGKIMFVFVFGSCSLVSVYFITSLASTHPLKVSFLDVGQGDAILVQTPSGKTMLIDGGPSDIVMAKLARQLSYFDNDIDVVVATHPDADHVTGLIPVLEKYNVHTVIVSPANGHTEVFDDLERHINEEHVRVYVAHTGDVVDFHDGTLGHILYPSKNYVLKKNDTNDASVSMEITYGDKTFLLTGDLPSKEEPKLIAGGLEKNIAVYKAGHHGSKYSSGEQLLSYIHPEYAVISAGKDNKYGHPNSETLSRLERYAKEILSTINTGTISFATDGRLMEVVTEH